MSEQEKFYSTMNLFTAPLRFAIDSLKAFVLLLIGLGCAIGYPVYLLVNGEPVTGISLAIAGLALLAIITFLYTPIYTIVMSVVFLFGMAWWSPQHITGSEFLSIIFGILILGIAFKYVRNCIKYNRIYEAAMQKNKKRTKRRVTTKAIVKY